MLCLGRFKYIPQAVKIAVLWNPSHERFQCTVFLVE